jgi:hypothetical protein
VRKQRQQFVVFERLVSGMTDPKDDLSDERTAFEAAASAYIVANPDEWPLLGGHDDEERWAFVGWRLALSEGTASLKAENERLRAERDDFYNVYSRQCGYTMAAQEEADALRTQLAEAQKDAQRYRWLRTHSDQALRCWGGTRPQWAQVLREEDLDSAIDAALTPKEPT